MGEIAAGVVEGRRPPKPKNAPDLGFCDSLWDLVQRCWDGKPELRPKATEVASRLGIAAAAWNGVMAPHVPIESIVPETPDPISDSAAHDVPRIINDLSEKQFRDLGSSFQNEDMARVIDELDKVRPPIAFHRLPPCYNQPRLYPLWILQILIS